MNCRNLIFILLLSSMISVFVPNVTLAGDVPEYRVLPTHQYLMDKTGDLALDEILAAEQAWLPGSGHTVHQGYVGEPLWLKFDLTTKNSQPFKLYMELGSPFLDQVEYYLVSKNAHGVELLSRGQAGDHRVTNGADLEHRFPIFELNIQQSGQYQVYLRIRTQSVIIAPVRFYFPEQFFSSEFRVQAFYGLFFGMMAVLAFYNGFVWAFIRERAYLYNMAFILFAMLYQSSINGFGQQYVWGAASFINDRSYGVGILATIYFAGRFAIRFLDLRNRAPRLEKVTHIIVTGFALLLIPVLLMPERLIMPVVYTMEILVCIYAIVVMIQQCISGSYWARYLLAGWSVLIVGTFFFVVSQLGWIDNNVLVEYVHASGLALGNVMVTSALAARIQRERSEKNQALNKALELAQEVTELTQEKEQIAASARDELERRVEQKTQALSEMLEQLKTSNEKLEHATLTDALTGVGNRRFMDNSFPALIKQCQQHRTPLGVLVIDADHFKRVNDEFGHLVGDACLKKIAVILQKYSRRNLDVLVRYGGEEFILLLPATDEEGVLKVAEAIRHNIQYASFWADNNRIPVTVSIGVHVGIPAAHITGEKLLLKADEALYQAKKNGRNRVELYRSRFELVNA
jgi:diguanylate cyclase (GGDEF)-like protein